MNAFLNSVENLMNTFGVVIVVPIILFVIVRFLGIKTKTALQTALFAGVGLEGFILLIGAFTPIISPVINTMVKDTGVNLPSFDIGWSATALVAYSTRVGLMFLVFGFIMQLLLYFFKFTNVFQASNLWNNYSFCIWGALCYSVTNNLILSFVLMIIMDLYSLLIAETLAPSWSKYYKYPNCTVSSIHNIETTIFTIILDPLLNLLGLNKAKVNPQTLKKKFGFIGEPITLGLIIGFLIGFVGNIKHLDTLKSWGTILTLAIATATVMAVFPKIAEFFGSAFMPIADKSQEKMNSQKKSNTNKKVRTWFLSIDDSSGYGEEATLISGIILIPIVIVLAALLPNNHVLPVVDLVALPYMVQSIVALTKGNIPKVVIIGAVYSIFALYVCSATTETFTQLASTTHGIDLSAVTTGAALITSFNVLGKPILGLIYFAFISQNPIFISLVFIVYIVLFILLKTKREHIWKYLENQANKNL
jgi:PTS system galactitol-specific IIC component